MMSGDIPYDAELPAVWVYRVGYGKCPLLFGINNAITDGGVAPPEILLTIVMMSSNFKSLRISRNSKGCREG